MKTRPDILATLFFFVLAIGLMHACARDPGEPGKSKITFTAPEPEPVAIFWIDSAGNLGLRGALAVVPGLPAPETKLSEPCRASATVNGAGTLTVCMEPVVGKVLAKELGLDTWTSGTSKKQ